MSENWTAKEWGEWLYQSLSEESEEDNKEGDNNNDAEWVCEYPDIFQQPLYTSACATVKICEL